MRNLCFKDITVLGGAGGSARIIGDSDTRVENLTFSNVQFNGSPPYVSFVDVDGLTLSRSGQQSDYDYENVTGIYVTNDLVDCGGAPPPPKKGDLNNDGKVDVIDFGILFSNWGKTTKPPADINQDGKVDVVDLGILLSNWE